MALELRDRDKALQQLKLHLAKAQEQVKQATNSHRWEVTFEVGDWVYLRLHPHKQNSAVQRINKKLAPRYYEPFQIEERNGPMAYKLGLPVASKVHQYFMSHF